MRNARGAVLHSDASIVRRHPIGTSQPAAVSCAAPPLPQGQVAGSVAAAAGGGGGRSAPSGSAAAAPRRAAADPVKGAITSPVAARRRGVARCGGILTHRPRGAGEVRERAPASLGQAGID